MLFPRFLILLVTTVLALSNDQPKWARETHKLLSRQENSTLDTLERAANSRLPEISLPANVSNSTKSLLQFITIWNEIEVSAYHNTTLALAQNATGYQEFNRWNKTEIVGILKNHQAESQLWLLYTTSLLTHYNISKPTGCRLRAFTGTGFSLISDVLTFQSFNTLLIDSLQDAVANVPTSERDLITLFWSMSTARAEQNGFYRLMNNEFPSERAFMTSIPASLSYSSITQVLRDCPFALDEILPVARPMFADHITGGFLFCANLSSIPERLDDLYLDIRVGLEKPILAKVENVTLNGTVVQFDAKWPREEYVLEGMVVAALREGKGGTGKYGGGKADEALAAIFIQVQQPFGGDVDGPADLVCPRSGSTEFWEMIGG